MSGLNDATSKPRVTTFELAGGLGNQLFQYTAGLAYEAVTGHRIAFDTSVIDRASNSQGKITEAFNLKGSFVNLEEEHPSSRLVFLKVASQVSKHLPLLARMLHLNRIVHVAPGTGLDAGLYEIPAGAFVRGYFQTHSYLQRLRNDKAWQDLEINNPSDWFLEQSAKIRKIKPRALHVRRGDYVKLGQIYGLLGPAYYEKVIAMANEADDTRPWVVFSDSILEAEILRRDCAGLTNSEVISPPDNSSPAESLVLMSLCGTKAIANSTFSFWAAALGDSSASVYVPQPWYKGLEDPEDLLPSGWKRVQSTWL